MEYADIHTLGGACPVQGEGSVLGVPFYFWARRDQWMMGVGEDPVGIVAESIKGWLKTGVVEGGMDCDEAEAIIQKCAKEFCEEKTNADKHISAVSKIYSGITDAEQIAKLKDELAREKAIGQARVSQIDDLTCKILGSPRSDSCAPEVAFIAKTADVSPGVVLDALVGICFDEEEAGRILDEINETREAE